MERNHLKAKHLEGLWHTGSLSSQLYQSSQRGLMSLIAVLIASCGWGPKQQIIAYDVSLTQQILPMMLMAPLHLCAQRAMMPAYNSAPQVCQGKDSSTAQPLPSFPQSRPIGPWSMSDFLSFLVWPQAPSNQ